MFIDMQIEQRRQDDGRTTAWPRLLTGKSSVRPWMSASSKACINDIKSALYQEAF